MNRISQDTSDLALQTARNLVRFKSDRRYRDKVLTEISDRTAAKKAAEQPLTPLGLAKMKFLKWEDGPKGVKYHLEKLSPEIIFSRLPGEKVAIGLKAPARSEVESWKGAVLSPWERDEVQRLGHHQGPRPFISCASMGWIAPYVDLISEGAYPEIVARSLVRVLKPLVEAGVFTWLQAEREFGFRLVGVVVTRERVPVTPRVWSTETSRPVTVVG